MNQSVWTPSRESAAVKAFMATLRLQSSAWQWTEDAEQAGWWIIDASTVDDVHALAGRFDDAASKPKVAFLARQMSQSPRPAWAYFKPPVPSGLIFNWVRPFARQATEPVGLREVGARETRVVDSPWRHGLLRLRRWPNVSRYGNVLELTVACSRLLTGPASYDQILQWQVPAPLLDRLLADAHAQGLVELVPESAAPAHAESSRQRPTDPAQTADGATEPSRWDLVKRLLRKFART